MKFSLIIPTKGRVEEVRRLLESLRVQSIQDFEVIISDQNTDDRLLPIIINSGFGDRIVHTRSSGGSSAGRNAGVNVAQGDFIGFPDDDCCYPPDLLEKVLRFFDSHPEYGMISGRSYSDDGSDSVSRHARYSGEIKKLSLYSQCIEFAFFIRSIALGTTRYDEEMGVGANTPWGSDEGPDLILRLMDQGIRGYYERDIGVWHPKPVSQITEATIKRSYSYSCGSGYFLRKHGYPIWYFLYQILRPCAGIALGAARFDSQTCSLYWQKVRGRIRGFSDYGRMRDRAVPNPYITHPAASRPDTARGKVSIIVINHNYGRFLKDCIESALIQSYDQCEVIVVDDGSTDDSREIIARYGDRISVILQPNQGQMAAYQSGLAASSGVTILFLDSDDYLHPDCIQRCMEKWHPGVAKIDFYLDVVNERSQSIGSRVPTGALDGKNAKAMMELYSSYSSPPGSGNLYTAVFLRRIFPVFNVAQLRHSADAVPIYSAPFHGEIISVPQMLGSYRRHVAANTLMDSSSKTDEIKESLIKEHQRDLLRDSSWRSVIDSPPDKTQLYLCDPSRFKRLVCYFRLNGYKGYEKEPRRTLFGIFLLGIQSISSWGAFSPAQKIMMLLWMTLVLLLPISLAIHFIHPALFREHRSRFLKYLAG